MSATAKGSSAASTAGQRGSWCSPHKKSVHGQCNEPSSPASAAVTVSENFPNQGDDGRDTMPAGDGHSLWAASVGVRFASDVCTFMMASPSCTRPTLRRQRVYNALRATVTRRRQSLPSGMVACALSVVRLWLRTTGTRPPRQRSASRRSSVSLTRSLQVWPCPTDRQTVAQACRKPA